MVTPFCRRCATADEENLLCEDDDDDDDDTVRGAYCCVLTLHTEASHRDAAID